MFDVYFDLVEEPGPGGKGKRMVKRRTKNAALFVLDEGAVLAALGGRNGSTKPPWG